MPQTSLPGDVELDTYVIRGFNAGALGSQPEYLLPDAGWFEIAGFDPFDANQTFDPPGWSADESAHPGVAAVALSHALWPEQMPWYWRPHGTGCGTRAPWRVIHAELTRLVFEHGRTFPGKCRLGRGKVVFFGEWPAMAAFLATCLPAPDEPEWVSWPRRSDARGNDLHTSSRAPRRGEGVPTGWRSPPRRSGWPPDPVCTGAGYGRPRHRDPCTL
jgi:hypothetical protein